MASRKSTATTAPEAVSPAEAPEESRTTLVGRLCADPQLRQTKATGKPVTTIRVAVNHEDTDATFHSVVVWGRTAEVVCQFLKKGRLVEVEGREQQRTFTANDGTERTVDEIVARRVQFLRSRDSGQPQAETEKEVA